MGFTPNNLLQNDTYSDRQLTAVMVSRFLRNSFNRASLDVVIPDNGAMFGVIDWDSDSAVDGKIMEVATSALKEWGFDDPVVALPCSSKAKSVHWTTPSQFRMKLELEG